MDSMMAAIRAKRGGGMGGEKPMMGQEMGEQEEQGSMKDIVDALDDNQKQELLQLLTQPKEKTPGIEQGEPSANEKQIIGKKANQEIEVEGPGEQSDDIAMSMLDRNSLAKAEQGRKPLGLGDRAKMAMALKLKDKGKLK